MSRLQLTASQRRRLEHVLQTARGAGLFRRVLAILEVDSGRSIAETARLLRTSRVTIYHWIGRFQRTREPTSLVDHRGGNRPSLGMRSFRTSFAPVWAIVPSHSVTRRSNGRSPCLGNTWHAGAGFAPRRVRSGGSCMPWATFGSDPGTYSTRIP